MKFKRTLASTLAAAMVCSSVPTNAFASDTASGVLDDNYELYPNVQEITYDDSVVTLPEIVNAVFEEGIDEYTVDRAEYALGAAGISMNTVDAANLESKNVEEAVTYEEPVKEETKEEIVTEEVSEETTEEVENTDAVIEAPANEDTVTEASLEKDTEEAVVSEDKTEVTEEVDSGFTVEPEEEITEEVDPGFTVDPEGETTEEVDPGFTVDLEGETTEEIDPGFTVDLEGETTEEIDPGFTVDPEGEATEEIDPGFGVNPDDVVDPGFTIDQELESTPEKMILNELKAGEDVQLLVGIYGNEDNTVDDWFNENVKDADYTVLEKTDSYMLVIKGNQIAVLGRDTDAAFYGLTTLKQIMTQINSSTREVRALSINDWADIASRGFIEGYYGEPWSVEDRAELMRFGGEIKLNSYFYAPKDDPKHNSRWRELYTQDELERLVKPLAEAGNASKCQFVFALHPFMYNPITNSNYDETIKILKAKFEQVMGAGVRQIAVLADDAGNQGSDLYIKLMTELVDWVSSEEMQSKYPGLKTTIPFCPVEYMYNGASWMSNLPEEVPVVMTGGKIWGEVSDNFTNVFYNNVKRGPYMWINWPCTDNSKRHLIMGGFKDFLHPGVNPEKIQGIVLNPMQQSEPSKVAIFGNACYSWNIWEDGETADQAWYDSFKYVDHETYKETPESKALREISKHMINQNMDSRVRVLQESVDLKPKLNEFKEKLANETLTKEDIESMRKEFTKLQEAAALYKESGNERLAGQMVYWLDTWQNVTEAADIFLNALEEYYINDNAGVVPEYYVAGQAQLEEAETHGFSYIDHTEYAEVGVQHIMPFLRTIRDKIAIIAELTVDPSKVIATPITNIEATTKGTISNIIDGNEKSEVYFEKEIKIGDYIGIVYNRPIAIDSVLFATGRSGNMADTFSTCKLEYTEDGVEWKDVPDVTFSGSKTEMKAENLGLKAKGIRMTATANNAKWLGVREIYINNLPVEAPVDEVKPLSGTVYRTSGYTVYSGAEKNLTDGDDSTIVWYNPSTSKKDTCLVGDYLGLDLGSVKKVGKVHIVVGDGSGDKWETYRLEYSVNGEEWTKVKDITGKATGKDTTDVDLEGVEARYVRIVNTKERNVWVKFSEFDVYEYVEDKTEVIHSEAWKIHQGSLDNLLDGKDNTFVWFDPDGTPNNPEHPDDSLVGDYIGLNLGEVKQIGNVRFVIGNGNGDKWKKYHLEYSVDGETYTPVKSFEGSQSGSDVIEVNLGGIEAQYVRMVNDEIVDAWIKFSEITVNEFNPETDTAKHAISNNADVLKGVCGVVSENEATISKASEITLNPGDYVGLELERISGIGSITVDKTGGETLTLKAGANLEEMKAYTEGKVNARYVYIQNDTDEVVTFHLNELKVTVEEATGIVFDSISSNLPLAPQWNQDDAIKTGTTGNWFDGNVNTGAVFSRYQVKDGWIMYDLGQTREIRKIEALIPDTNQNYIRDGLIEVAADKDGEWTTVVTMTDNKEATEWDSSTAGSIGWGQASSNYPNFRSFSGELESPVNARYLRVKLTSNYSHRFIGLNEIIINDGEYVPVNGNPTFVVDPAEVSADFVPENIIDGSITTAFKPNMTGRETGSLVYNLSDVTHIDQINVLQSSSAISNAKVYVRGTRSNPANIATLSEENDNWVQVGTLTEPLTTVYTYMFDSIYSIKLEWENVTPVFYEIVTVANGALEIDTTQLSKLYASTGEIEDESYYDEQLLKAYKDARAYAEGILNGTIEPKTQSEVLEAYDKLNAAYKELINSITELDIAKKELQKVIDSYDEALYTKSSWTAFVESEAYTKAIEALEGSDIEAIKQAAIDVVEEAKVTLKLSGDTKALETMVEEAEKLNKDDYTSNTYAKLEETLKATKDALAKGDLSEEDVAKLLENLSNAIEGLEKAPTEESSSSSGGGHYTVKPTRPGETIKDDDVPLVENPDDKEDALFADVTENSWFYESLEFAVENNLISGINGKFEPNLNTTRAMLVAVLHRIDNNAETTKELDFKDVTIADWFYNDIAWAVENGIVSGMSEDTFAPNDNLTREQLAVMIYQYAKYKEMDTEVTEDHVSKYDDVSSVSEWAKEGINFCIENGIFSGRTEKELAPKAFATRAELVSVIDRFVNEK